MKKTIIGISAVLLSASIILANVNAQNGPQEEKKSCTEKAKSSQGCQAASSCCKTMKYGSTAVAKPCEKAACKEDGSVPSKETATRCGHECCKKDCTASCEAKKCQHENNKSGSPE